MTQTAATRTTVSASEVATSISDFTDLDSAGCDDAERSGKAMTGRSISSKETSKSAESGSSQSATNRASRAKVKGGQTGTPATDDEQALCDEFVKGNGELFSALATGEHFLSKSFDDTKDNVALRFLRAREFDFEKTAKLLKECREYRELNVPAGRIPQNVRTMQSGNSRMLGFAHDGRPVMWSYLRWYRPWEYKLEEGILNSAFQMDRILEICARQQVAPMTYSVVDLSDWNMWHQYHSNYQIANLKMANILYPEISGPIFLVNPPLWFRAAWAVLSPFVPEETKGKIKWLTGMRCSPIPADAPIAAGPDHPRFNAGAGGRDEDAESGGVRVGAHDAPGDSQRGADDSATGQRQRPALSVRASKIAGVIGGESDKLLLTAQDCEGESSGSGAKSDGGKQQMGPQTTPYQTPEDDGEAANPQAAPSPTGSFASVQSTGSVGEEAAAGAEGGSKRDPLGGSSRGGKKADPLQILLEYMPLEIIPEVYGGKQKLRDIPCPNLQGTCADVVVARGKK